MQAPRARRSFWPPVFPGEFDNHRGRGQGRRRVRGPRVGRRRRELHRRLPRPLRRHVLGQGRHRRQQRAVRRRVRGHLPRRVRGPRQGQRVCPVPRPRLGQGQRRGQVHGARAHGRGQRQGRARQVQGRDGDPGAEERAAPRRFRSRPLKDAVAIWAQSARSSRRLSSKLLNLLNDKAMCISGQLAAAVHMNRQDQRQHLGLGRRVSPGQRDRERLRRYLRHGARRSRFAPLAHRDPLV